MPVKKAAVERTLHVAGIRISFLPDLPPHQSPRKELTKPGSRDERDHIVIRLHLAGQIPEFAAPRHLFHSLWTLSQSGEKYIFHEGPQEAGPLQNKVLILGTDLKEGDLYVTESPSDESLFPDPLGYPLNQALMILLLSRRRGILFHACGIVDGESGYLFLGNSGYGKSTMAQLWFTRGLTVLNDDRIVAREEEGEFWMHGTPWHGDFKEFSARGMPISKVFFLHPSEENRLISHKGAKAVSMLLTRSFPPLWDKEGMIFTVGFCHRLVSAVPCYEFHFKQDRSVIDFIRHGG